MKPRVFIGSSVEGRDVAYAAQQNLLHDAEATVWNQGVFELSSTTIESLNGVLNTTDFAIFVFSPDDVTKMRGTEQASVRDNVVFELGLFIGKLGRERVFFVMPSNVDMHIATDLSGVTAGKFDAQREDGNLQAATGPVCNQIRIQIKKLGILNAEKIKPDEPSEPKQQEDSTGWFIDFVGKNYDQAEAKLKTAIDSCEIADKQRLQPWLPYMAYKKDPSTGISGLQEFSRSHITEKNAQSSVAHFLLWEGFTDEALSLINNLDVGMRSESEILTVLADCYIQSGETTKAIDILSESENPKNPDIAEKLAEVYTESGNQLHAFEVIRYALLKSPKNEKLLYKCARLAGEIDEQKIAAHLLSDLTRKYPENPDYWGYFGNCCLALDLYDHALSAYKRADSLTSGNAGWICGNIGNLFSNQGLPTEAVIYLKKAAAMDEDSQYAHDRLARALHAKGEHEKLLSTACDEGRALLRNWAMPKEAETVPFNTLLGGLLSGKNNL